MCFFVKRVREFLSHFVRTIASRTIGAQVVDVVFYKEFCRSRELMRAEYCWFLLLRLLISIIWVVFLLLDILIATRIWALFTANANPVCWIFQCSNAVAYTSCWRERIQMKIVIMIFLIQVVYIAEYHCVWIRGIYIVLCVCFVERVTT